MKSNLNDREFDKFREAPNDKSSVSVSVDAALPIESAGVDWDEIITTFPSNTQELYTYKKSTSTVQTVLVTYQNGDKKTILNMTRTRF
jgi:hypothetical protein